MFVMIPKGFFPTQDTGLITGISVGGQDVSPAEMKRRQTGALQGHPPRIPDVASFGSFLRQRLRQHAQHRPLLHRVEAARRTLGERQPGDRPVCVRSSAR